MRSKNSIWAAQKLSRAMRRLMRRIPPAVIFAGLALVGGCHSLRPAANGVLRIGVVADSPPLVFRQDGQWCGVEADLGRALAARLGMKPAFISCPRDRLDAALLDGKVDILMAGTTLSENRRVQMDFASPYLVVGQAALVRQPDLPRVNTQIKIRSVAARVGVVEGSPGDRLVSRYFTHASRVAFPNAEEAADALCQGQIDMLIYDAPAAWWLSLRHETRLAVAPPLFAREEVAWAFRRSSVALREDANQALTDWQKDGTLESILRRWIPVSR